MSSDELTKGIERMRDSGSLAPSVARDAINRPVEGAVLVRVERIETETARQSLALFGDKHLDPPGEIPGLLKDVKDLKYLVYRGLWLVAGGLSVGGFFIGTGLAILGLLIEWSRR